VWYKKYAVFMVLFKQITVVDDGRF